MKPEDILHGKIITSTPQADGTKVIETETLYDGDLAGFKREIEKSCLVDRQSVLKQVIDDMSIKSATITIVIHKNKQLEPERVVTKWSEITDKLGRHQ